MVSRLAAGAERLLDVQVLAPDYSAAIGSIGDYQSCSVTWQNLGVGSGSITTPERGAPALQLLQAIDYVVPITVKAPGLPRWSGRVLKPSLSRPSGTVGQITATLVDDTKWIQKILAVPVPGSGYDAQTVEHDTRSGPLETVAKAYLQANVDRLTAEYEAQGLGSLPVVVAPAPLDDPSPSVSLQARNVPIQSLLVDALRTNGRDLTAVLWLPGDPDVAGLGLTQPVIVVDVVTGRNRPYVNFTDTSGGVASVQLAGTHAGALSVLVLGPGEGAARSMVKVYAADGRLERLGRWGWPEEALEASDVANDADLNANLIQRGRDKLATDLAATASVAPTLNDRRPWVIAPDGDLWVGDLARATFSGVTVEDRIDRVTATHNGDGFTVQPQYGSARDTESTDVQLARTVAQVRAQLAQMQAGR